MFDSRLFHDKQRRENGLFGQRQCCKHDIFGRSGRFPKHLWFALTIFFSFILLSCATAPSRPGGSTVAIWNVENLTPSEGDQPDLGEILSAKIMEAVGNQENYTVVEREKLLLALEELKLGSSAIVDVSTQLELGRMVGAHLMVFGGYQVIAQHMRIDLRLVDVETGKIIGAASRMAQSADIAAWLDAAEDTALELF